VSTRMGLSDISEQAVSKRIMLKETVDGEFTATEGVAEAALSFASFESNAITARSRVVSRGWYRQ
jgi:3-hydroxybutyrate dehydrogenase